MKFVMQMSRYLSVASAIISSLLHVAQAAAPNTPPHLAINSAVNVLPGGVAVIGSTNLLTTDAETVDPAEITYKINPGTTNQTEFSGGQLFLGTKALQTGDTFSQADVNNRVLTWHAPSVISDPGIAVPFNVRDFEGNLASDGPFTVFALHIDYINTPPVPVNMDVIVALGNSATNQLRATNAETFQALTFRLVSKPTKGTVTLIDTNTGQFVYKADIGQSGFDYVQFQVSDGQLQADTPGVVRMILTNAIPVVPPQKFVVDQNDVMDGVVVATDVDLPKQSLSFNLISGPLRGTMVSFDGATGRFTYRPNPGRFGYDHFTVSAVDPTSESAYQEIEIGIRGIPDNGSLIVLGREDGPSATNSVDDIGGIYIINPKNGDTFRLYESDIFRGGIGLRYNAVLDEYFVSGDGDGGSGKNPYVAAVNGDTGELRPVLFGTNSLTFPVGLNFDHTGKLLVTDGKILRVDPVTSAVTIVSQGNLLKLPTFVGEEASGSLLVLDAIALFDDFSEVLRINPTNGVQTLLSTDARLLDPTDYLDLGNRKLLLGRGGLFDFNTVSNSFTQIIPGSDFQMLAKSMATDGAGHIYIVDLFTGVDALDLATTNFSVVNLELQTHPVGIISFYVPNTMSDWRATYFTREELADPTKEAALWGDNADPDGDGQPNLVEYALGLNPRKADAKKAIEFKMKTASGSSNALLSFKVRKSYGSAHYLFEGSSDLRTWSTNGMVLDDAHDAGASFEKRTYRSPVSGGSSKQFFRLKILP